MLAREAEGMKRTGIFALAAGCAMGVTALVGGIGYASALDVAEQAGRSIDVSGVSTADSGRERPADSAKLDPTPAPTDEAAAETSDEVVDDTDAGAVDEVAPSDPVVIDGTKGAHGAKDTHGTTWGAKHTGDKHKHASDRKPGDTHRLGEHGADKPGDPTWHEDRGGDRHSDGPRSGKGGHHGGKHGGKGWGGRH